MMTNKPTILVVDDSADSLHILVEALRDECAVMVARSGAKALEMIHHTPQPELVLLDVMMPDMDGYEVCRRIQQDPASRHIPVLFITSLQEAHDEQRALNMGGVDFIRKPINPKVVKARTLTHVELARARRQLEAQNRRLREDAKLRDMTERIMHHDLKGPLGVIIGTPELLMEEENISPEQKEMLGWIIRNGYVMLEMINRSLDLYKMEEGVYPFHPRPVDLYQLLARLVVEHQALSREKAAPVRICPDAGTWQGRTPWLVPGEELLCRSLFGNLLKNALEATPHGAPVTITLERSTERVTARLHNQGAVPDSIRHTFFSKFKTLNKEGGTGLGCYSAQLMARVQEADIAMESTEQEGTTLTVRFPAWSEPS